MQTKKIITGLLLFLGANAAGAQQRVHAMKASNGAVPPPTSFSVRLDANRDTPCFNLFIDNPQHKPLQLIINHKVLGLVNDTTITDTRFSRRYDMATAEDGSYTVTVRCGKEKITRTVSLNTVMAREVVVQ